MYIYKVYREVLEDPDSSFLTLIIIATFYGLAIKNVESINKKKWLCTTYGIVNIFILFGYEAWHVVIGKFLCAFLVIKVGKRKCHLVALAFCFVYVSTFRMLTPHNVNFRYKNICIMTLFLRAVGVAFEINYSYKAKVEKEQTKKTRLYEFSHQIDPTLSELLHYQFSFMGMHLGPYVRYRTYDDFIHLPFARAVSLRYCAQRFIMTYIYTTALAFIGVAFRHEYTVTDEFAERHFLFKTIYIYCVYASFKLIMFSGWSAGECNSGSVGLGAYPVTAENHSCHGPTKGYNELRKMTFEEAKNTEMDFETLTGMNVMDIQKSLWVTESLRMWNKNVQYFMGMFVYKILPISWNQRFRYFLTLEISTLWHGAQAGFTIGMFTPVLLVPAEKTLMKIYSEITGWKRRVAAICQWLIKTYLIGYGMLMVLLMDGDRCLKCTKALYFTPFIILFFVYSFVFLYNVRNKKNKSID